MIREQRGDIFSSKDNLAHCVSMDFAMFKGVAKEFKSRFGVPTQKATVGQIAVLRVRDTVTRGKYQPGRLIFFLVTKGKFFYKPKLSNIRRSLLSLKNYMMTNGIKSVSLPRIGSGLDRQDWPTIRNIITDIFSTSPDIIVTIYSLD